jgi:hypothetical protein
VGRDVPNAKPPADSQRDIEQDFDARLAREIAPTRGPRTTATGHKTPKKSAE